MDKIIHDLFISKKDIIKDNIEYKYLGKGGTGVVYKMKEGENYFAIKIIPKDKFNLNEYKIGIYLNGLLNGESINFIKLYEKIDYTDYVVLKMELLEGNLAEWSKSYHNEQEWFLCILQILINLRMLQQKINLFHRDMKPKNILFKKYDNQVKFIYELT
jgi:serine/threonine protein kinase